MQQNQEKYDGLSKVVVQVVVGTQGQLLVDFHQQKNQMDPLTSCCSRHDHRYQGGSDERA